MLGLNEKRREVRPDWMDRHLRSIRDSATRELLGLHQRRIRVLEKQCAIGVAGILVHDALEQAEKFKWPLSAASAGPQTREQHEDALLVEFRGGGGRVDRDRNGTPRFKGIAKLVDARAGKVGSNESTIRKDLKAAYARERKALSEGSAAEPLFAEAPFGWPARQGRR
ncbi:MAG: hypothetical protein EOO27_08755 [Comamonadaceae bacterium]|nr:MAG: hypothetical protein EOO27_08755 [Comamonadaceae bacterium]